MMFILDAYRRIAQGVRARDVQLLQMLTGIWRSREIILKGEDATVKRFLFGSCVVFHHQVMP